MNAITKVQANYRGFKTRKNIKDSDSQKKGSQLGNDDGTGSQKGGNSISNK
jgi:hypothetical protein